MISGKVRTSVLAATAAVCVALAGCGEDADGETGVDRNANGNTSAENTESTGQVSAADTTKRLPEGGPCDLVTPEDVAQVLGTEAEDIEVDPTDEIQCDYDSSSMLGGANVIRGQDMSAMATDEQVDLAGIPGTRLEGSDAVCSVSVKLDSEDPEQQFTVAGSAVPSKTDQSPCDIADGVAIAILDKLPE